MEALLDFSTDFNVALLEQTVEAMYDPRSPHQAAANTVLTQLGEHPEAWTVVDSIISNSTNEATKFFGMQILENTIKYRWQTLPAEQRDGMKNYIVQKIISMSEDEGSAARERVYLGKMNLALVQILKQEWPHNWPTFIDEIVGASKASEELCLNNLLILKLLSEEIFDFSQDQMTAAKTQHLKETLNTEFSKIFELCLFVLKADTKPQLHATTLQTLLRFLSWIPVGYIFETELVETLCVKYFPQPHFRNDALACLTEIAGLSLSDVGDAYNGVFVNMYSVVMEHVAQLFDISQSLQSTWETTDDVAQTFIQRLALFLTSFLRNHLALVETPEHMEALRAGMHALVSISDIHDEPELFKICLEFWQTFNKDLYTAQCSYMPSAGMLSLGGRNQSEPRSAEWKKAEYSQILTRLRTVMIEHMAQPEEVLIEQDESGDIVRKTTTDTDAVPLYRTMRETLVYLTHLDAEDTERIMLDKLAKQVNGSEWGWDPLNTLSWAIGSISGTMSEHVEKGFLVTVIKDLLGLCEAKSGKNNKAVVASNIMYVVGQYPRFLRAHWRFLRTVVLKLFEFMHETHPGVQDMACDTFLKIAQKCRKKFCVVQPGEPASFFQQMCASLQDTIGVLEAHQKQTFYEAAGYMINAEPDPNVQVDMVAELLAGPNAEWAEIMDRAAQDVSTLQHPDAVKAVARILKINTHTCRSAGAGFYKQVAHIFNDLLNVLSVYSASIAGMVQEQGPVAIRYVNARYMRNARKAGLELLEMFVNRSNDPKMIAADFVPPLLEPLMNDYNESPNEAKEPEVLGLFASIVKRLHSLAHASVPSILSAVLECTLSMITANFEDFPDHRRQFYELLHAIVQHCFEAITQIPPEQQRLVVDCMVWGLKHPERNIQDLGLNSLQLYLERIQHTGELAQQFYGAYFLRLVQDVFFVLTDRLHKSGFPLQAGLLAHLFGLIQSGQVLVPLFEGEAPAGMSPAAANQSYVREFVTNLIAEGFSNLTPAQVAAFIDGLMSKPDDGKAYKMHLRDFLVDLKEFKGEDNADMYADEAEAQAALAAEQDRDRRLAVPGLMNPHEME